MTAADGVAPDPGAAQRIASDPAVSAFVAASAGSGKTKLLTDRLLRLMLGGADPSRIRCLTFTKAAAAEMAIRLQTRLSAWVTAPDATLDRDLAGFGLVPGDALRTKARALFAEVLDLPGGMRIGTIHAFCQSLLRRFPLEARLSPHFRLLDEIDAESARVEAREAMLAGAHTEERRAALTTLAGLVSLDGFGGLVRKLEGEADRLARLAALSPEQATAAIDRALGVNREARAADACEWPDEAKVRDAARLIADKGSAGAAAIATRMLDWFGLHCDERAEHWSEWREIFLNNGKPRGLSNHVNPKLAKEKPDLPAILQAEQSRILDHEDLARAAQVADLSVALLRLATPVLDSFAAHKEDAEQLDFADLIARTNALLKTPGAEWVRYKLDGGLDHLLLDEVQDTAPEQWTIAAALTDDFFAGEGARAFDRTIFAVGDRKQSIYSFQGADPDAFEHWRMTFGALARTAGARWEEVPLTVSFRSTAPVLALVDQVFADPVAARGVVARGETLTHSAFRTGHAGRVEFWPLTPRPEKEEPTPWHVPERNMGGINAPQRLADTLAGWIAQQTGGAVMLESRGRPLRPGDVLILVRRRTEFARALVRALKQRGVPVAGIDRMTLTDQPAVADLLALCDALLLPGDDLQFACLLTSPLGGLSDDSLMALAMGRDGTLRDTLRRRAAERPDWAAAERFFASLFARVDFASPYALLSEALGPFGGRARLLARLGPEAAEPVDELLGAALTYAANHPSSLQGFVHALRQSGAEVKREAEGAGHLVRVMTVHGAKGLQAPLVILPDTTTLPADETGVLWGHDPQTGIEVPVWSPRAELRCKAVDALREAGRQRQLEEYNRLLYVALTRAEDRLLVCGWETHKTIHAECWFELVRRGFERLPDVETHPFDATAEPWPGERLVYAGAQTAPPDLRAEVEVAAATARRPEWTGSAPAWTAAPPPDEPALASPLAPSRPQDAALGTVPSAASPLASRDASGDRFRRGELVHTLLQHLPDLPPDQRRAAAARYLDRPGSPIPPPQRDALADEVMAVLGHPLLQPVFGQGSRAEVPLTGVVHGQVVGGLVDRIIVLDGRVLVADYKTNRAPPASPERVPLLYLRQMAAYRDVLRGAFPGRTIECALVWTVGARVMMLDDGLLDPFAPGSGGPRAPAGHAPDMASTTA